MVLGRATLPPGDTGRYLEAFLVVLARTRSADGVRRQRPGMPLCVPRSAGVTTAGSGPARDVGSAEAEEPCLPESQPTLSGLRGAHTVPASVKVLGESMSLGSVLEELMGK